MAFVVSVRATGIALVLVTLSSALARAQNRAAEESSWDLKQAIHDLQAEVQELREAVSELRVESQRYRTEADQLRREIEAAHAVEATPNRSASNGQRAVAPETPMDRRLTTVEEEQELLKQKINEQYQTKVESASKYRVRLSGIVLMNAFNNQGAVDSIDVPTVAVARNPQFSAGSIGATLRQSQLGLEAFGPTLAGARTRAEVQLDFAGGFPAIPNGVTSGLVRMRTAAVGLDWERTSIVIGQDALFLAPHAPTSFASLIVPPLSYAGNLWGWVPQIRVEQKFELTERSSLKLQAGVLDPLAGEPPGQEYNRQPSAGENSRAPGVGARVAWSQQVLGRDLSIGFAGYYSRQNWGFNRDVNGWAGMTDWQIPLTSWLQVTGDFYRGSALGGFGGGIGRSVLWNGPLSDPATSIRPLDSLGGWAQLKILATPKLELNGAAGQDNAFAQDVRAFARPFSYVNSNLTRNRSALANFVYRPRSDLLLSAEFRRLHSFQINNDSQTANQINLAMGFLF